MTEHKHDHEHDHEEEVNQATIIYQLLQQRLQELSQQGSLIEKTYFEVEATLEGMKNLKDIAKGDLLVPMGNGLYIKSKGVPEATDKILVNIGSNLVVEKSQKETESMLKERSQELQKVLNQVATEMQRISEQMNQITSGTQG